MGIHMGIVTDEEHTVIASQFAQRGQKRKLAHEVRDELFLSPPACEPIETAVVWNRYDVLVSLKPGTNVVKLAGIWDTVDKIVMNNVMHSTRIFGDAKTVTPPNVFVHYPPVLSLSNVNKFMHHFGAVQDIQLEKHGTAVVTYVYIESAYVAVGVSTPFGQYGMITITSGSDMDDVTYNSKLENFRTHTSSMEARKQFGGTKMKLTPSSLDASVSSSTPTQFSHALPPEIDPSLNPAPGLDENMDPPSKKEEEDDDMDHEYSPPHRAPPPPSLKLKSPV